MEKADIESVLLSLGNISGIFMGTQDGNVTTTASMMQNILEGFCSLRPNATSN